MNWLTNSLRGLRGRLFRRNRVVRIPPPPGQPSQANPSASPPFPPGVNPMAETLRRFFATRDRALERHAFRPIGPDGTVDETVEEWFRDGDENIARTHHIKVVTCSGEIVAPDRLQGVCWCTGYDDVIARCQACGLPLCRLHRRVFHSESGEVVLCDRHYRDAVDAFNTWQALDRQRQARRSS